MTKLCIVLLGSLLTIQSDLAAQPYASWTKAELRLNNGLVERIIQLPSVQEHFITTSYKPVEGAFKYFGSDNSDFQFEINQKVYSGNSHWS